MAQTDDVGNNGRFSISIWLAFYSGTFLLGGIYVLSLLWIGRNAFPLLTAILGCASVATGLLLGFRKRAALPIYLAIAIGFLLYSAYRYSTDGYNSGRVAIALGGLLMLAGYSSVAEEIPLNKHRM